MRSRLAQHRSFALLLAAATLLHLLLLLIPVVRPQAPGNTPSPTVTIQLSAQPPDEAPPETLPEPPGPVIPEPVPPEHPPLEAAEPVELAELPAPEQEPPAATAEEEPQISAYRILSELREKDPLTTFDTGEPEDRPDYYVRYQPSVEDIINEPSLQLPFRDTRIYLVDSYDPGFLGGVQRFFDDVTVPFGFTTKNNTRVQCAWILVIAGCSWGDVSYYYAKDKARKRR